MDGDTTDSILRFSHWYNQRLIALPRLGDTVETLYERIFSDKLIGKAPRVYVLDDAETWLPESWGFWIDTNGDSRPQSDNGILNLKILSNNEPDPAGVVYSQDSYFINWLEERFIPLVQTLYQYGYGLSQTKNVGDMVTDIRNVKEEIKEFEDVIKELYSASYDHQVESFDEWIALFYNGTTNKEDWYKRMEGWVDKGEVKEGWVNKIEAWVLALQDRVRQIDSDLDRCSARGPWE